MKLNYLKILYPIIICIAVFSCVEEIDLKFKTNRSVIVVDANISNVNSQQFVILKQSLPSEDGANFQFITGAEVLIIEDDKKNIVGKDEGNGKYVFPSDFRAKVLSSYQLKFSLSNGNKYSSTKEVLRATPEILNVYATYDRQGYEFKNQKWPSHNIYIDTKDNPEIGDFYNWSWTLYEKQNFCISCEGGKYFTSPPPLGRCIEDARLKRSGTIYDYNCDKPCWEVKNSTEINAMSDIYSNGNPINGRLIGKIPYYQNSGCLVEVKQQSLSSGAYKYLKLLIDQSQNSGSLVDTPPGALIGNITNDNDKFESVGGYFFVSGTSKWLFWLDRNEPIRSNETALGLLNGRKATNEPNGMDLTRPPLAPCVISTSRTSIRPLGWLD